MSKAANIRIKPVELELNGEKYLIKYDMNALIELEDIYDSIEDAVEAMSGIKVYNEDGNPTMEDEKDKDGNIVFEEDGVTPKKVQKRKFKIKPIRDFLWCGLLAYHKGITQEKVTSLLSFIDLKEIVEKLTEALNRAMPVVKEDEVKN
jgi:hypothetical protein